jgi:hypothetical protein
MHAARNIYLVIDFIGEATFGLFVFLHKITMVTVFEVHAQY